MTNRISYKCYEQIKYYENNKKPVDQAIARAAHAMSPEEIYELFLPRFGVDFTRWFTDQYKRKSN